jgi:hypothetical protein
MNKILFVIPTAKEVPDNTQYWYAAGHDCEYHFIRNNRSSLLKAMLSVKCSDYYGDCDYIICLHDDVWLRDNALSRIIDKSFREFDYWGVAGTNMMLTSNPRWHVPLGGKKYLSGHMEHVGKDDLRWTSTYGMYPQPCSILDGVFIAWKKEVFDSIVDVPEFDGFHMYDMEMCTQAWEMGYKGGAVGLNLFHESRGEGILTKDWDKYAKIYSDRWSKYKLIGG